MPTTLSTSTIRAFNKSQVSNCASPGRNLASRHGLDSSHWRSMRKSNARVFAARRTQDSDNWWQYPREEQLVVVSASRAALAVSACRIPGDSIRTPRSESESAGNGQGTSLSPYQCATGSCFRVLAGWSIASSPPQTQRPTPPRSPPAGCDYVFNI
jgi:hypothetical protein